MNQIFNEDNASARAVQAGRTGGDAYTPPSKYKNLTTSRKRKTINDYSAERAEVQAYLQVTEDTMLSGMV